MTRHIAAAAIAASLAAFVAAPASAREAKTFNSNVTEAEVLAAQKAWGDALVRISTDFQQGGIERARATASAILDAAYGYNLGPVLFKPTLTVAPQTFRTTREGALAYFVGGDSNFPQDTGFALKGWRSVEIRNAAIHINGDVAKTMGKVLITNSQGQVTEVDKTWAFKKDDRGALRIVLHHSSLPFQAPAATPPGRT
jgi:hypothetical protein